ncbi:unnamed protein product [Schistocephalus solidus]|uniref:BHLH domain-containing protein n=1 Tax=Schistocephalus solidus TaxID=70667 RepID=A0A183SL52_SCHSO|nr:unnamed protein product [Schistocephalus solidus]
MCTLPFSTVPIVPNVLMTFKAKSVIKSIFEREEFNCTWDDQFVDPLMNALMQLAPVTPSTPVHLTLSEIDFIDPAVSTGRQRKRVKYLLLRLKVLADECNINTTMMTIEIRKSRMDKENFAVAMLFASKPIVQLIVNPMVGPLTNK